MADTLSLLWYYAADLIMDEKDDVSRRIGGYLVLVMMVFAFVWLWQAKRGDETAVFTTAPAIPTASAPQETDENSETAVVEADFSQPVPIRISDDTLSPDANPHTYQIKQPTHNFETYVIQSGDTPRIIAAKFGISPATLLGGNPQMSNEANALQDGATITILPIDGVLHVVRPGEKLEGIAEQYNVAVEDIIAYESNNLEFPFRLEPEMELLIPGAEVGSFHWSPPRAIVYDDGEWAVVGTGSYVWPVNGRCLTQRAWYGHMAIDVSTAVGDSLYAADTGTVTYASWAAGTYYDYGNLIVINHGNGYETLYAHLSAIGVSAGQTVEKGQWIGATGNTGRSTGPHLHFEIRLRDVTLNPLNYLAGPVGDCS